VSQLAGQCILYCENIARQGQGVSLKCIHSSPSSTNASRNTSFPLEARQMALGKGRLMGRVKEEACFSLLFLWEQARQIIESKNYSFSLGCLASNTFRNSNKNNILLLI
jgi:hypothetical protein